MIFSGNSFSLPSLCPQGLNFLASMKISGLDFREISNKSTFIYYLNYYKKLLFETLISKRVKKCIKI